MRARDIENLQPIRADFLHKLAPEICERLGLPSKDIISIEIGFDHLRVEAYVTDANGDKVRLPGADDAAKHVFDVPITHPCHEAAPSGTHIGGMTPMCELDRGHVEQHRRTRSGQTLYWGPENADAGQDSFERCPMKYNVPGHPVRQCELREGHDISHRWEGEDPLPVDRCEQATIDLGVRRQCRREDGHRGVHYWEK